MASIFGDFHEAQRVGSGQLLATSLAPVNDDRDPRKLESFSQLSNYQSVAADVRYHLTQDRSISVKLSKAEANAWTEIFTDLWTSVREVVSIEKGDAHASWSNAFTAYDKMCNRLIRGYTHDGFQAWTVPCLTSTGKQLRLLAMKADAARSKESSGFVTDFGDEPPTNEEHAKLQKAAWTINRMFAICLNDRSDLSESRKWGLYSTTNLLFKTYFQLSSISLCKNVLMAINAQSNDIPPLNLFPKSHRCTFQYYRGLISFLDEAYEDAEQRLTAAYNLCHPAARHNREQILIYLIATRILTSRQLPSPDLLSQYPHLDSLFSPICTAIRLASVSSFDAALASSERTLIKKRVYLPLERSRELVLRNLFRRVFLAGGFEDTTKTDVTINTTIIATATLAEPDRLRVRRTRIPIIEFEAAMRISLRNAADNTYADGVEIPDRDEVECLIAGLIYKNLMKGYIARDRGIVVLSKTGAFPGTNV